MKEERSLQLLVHLCHLNRQIGTLIAQAGFEIEHIEHSYLKGAPKFGGFLYRGVAKRPEP